MSLGEKPKKVAASRSSVKILSCDLDAAFRQQAPAPAAVEGHRQARASEHHFHRFACFLALPQCSFPSTTDFFMILHCMPIAAKKMTFLHQHYCVRQPAASFIYGLHAGIRSEHRQLFLLVSM